MIEASLQEIVPRAQAYEVKEKRPYRVHQRIVDKYGILLIADEVITGFGRTGNWFGSQTFGIKPHIMTIAKGLSSGYQPIGGSIVCDEVAEVMASKGDFNHGYT